jgi:Lar family restriction alleviation protein
MMELRPCPFCGGEAEYRHVSGIRHPWSGVQADALAITVNCIRCGATIPSGMSQERVTAAWNRRADAWASLTS